MITEHRLLYLQDLVINMKLDGSNYQPTPQPTPDTCFPAAMKTILDGLRSAHNINELNFDVMTIARFCRWQPVIGVPKDLTLPKANLNKIFNRFGYRVEDGFGGVAMNMGIIEAIVNDTTKSAPIVTFGTSYFAAAGYRIIGRADNWHQVVITDFNRDTNTVEIFDTLNKRGHKTTLSTVQFSNFWSAGDYSTIWIEKTKDKLKGKVQKRIGQ